MRACEQTRACLRGVRQCTQRTSSVPLVQAHGASPCGCHAYGALPPFHSGRRLSIAFLGFGQMRLECAEQLAISARVARNLQGARGMA